jgi:hypothetical protein
MPCQHRAPVPAPTRSRGGASTLMRKWQTRVQWRDASGGTTTNFFSRIIGAATVTTLDILVKVELGYIIHVALHADWDARGCGTGDLRSVTNQVRVRSSRMCPLGSQK